MIELYKITRDIELFKKAINNWTFNDIGEILHDAIMEDQLEVVKHLIEKHKDLIDRDIWEIDWAIRNKQLKVSKYLEGQFK